MGDITITVSTELKGLLTDISATLTDMSAAMRTLAAAMPSPGGVLKVPASGVLLATETHYAPAPANGGGPTAGGGAEGGMARLPLPDVSVEMIRAKANEKISLDEQNRIKIKELLASYGVANVSSLEKPMYAAFYVDLEAV